MNDESRTFGEVVRARREEMELSVRRAAEAASIHESLWRQIEKGHRQVTKDVQVPVSPTPRSVRGMARALGLDVVEMLELAGHEPTDADRKAATGDGTDPVVEAIIADTTLLPEAKSHFLNQLALLRRISGPARDLSEVEARAELDRIASGKIVKVKGRKAGNGPR